MSVLIEGICVVVQRATIEDKYRGGVAQYAEDCPNNMYCADEHLTAVGFQVLDDAYRWIRRLEIQDLVFIQKGVYREHRRGRKTSRTMPKMRLARFLPDPGTPAGLRRGG